MRKLQEINYNKIEKGLKNIESSFSELDIKEVNKDFNFDDYFNLFYSGYSALTRKHSIVTSDLDKLAKQIIFYFYCIIKNFKFVDFYDKEFVDAFKFLIKDKEEFERFLNFINLSVEDFLHLSIYICQTAFTSNLIKFIQTNYLGIVVKKEPKKTKRKKK